MLRGTPNVIRTQGNSHKGFPSGGCGSTTLIPGGLNSLPDEELKYSSGSFILYSIF